MAGMNILFDGFSDLARQIDKAGENLEKAVDEALTNTFDVVQDNVRKASAIYSAKGGGKKGYATGSMYRAIKTDSDVYWVGSIAEVSVGFNLGDYRDMEAGFHSIFIMYGTPKYPKDRKVYNSIKGTKTRKDIAKIQQETMMKYINLG